MNNMVAGSPWYGADTTYRLTPLCMHEGVKMMASMINYLIVEGFCCKMIDASVCLCVRACMRVWKNEYLYVSVLQ